MHALLEARRSRQSASRPRKRFARKRSIRTLCRSRISPRIWPQALIAASQPGEKILLYRAQEARDVLPERLRAAGREPWIVAAYKTVFTQDAEFAGKVARSDILTFTSSSTVRGFAHNLGGDAHAAKAAHRSSLRASGRLPLKPRARPDFASMWSRMNLPPAACSAR